MSRPWSNEEVAILRHCKNRAEFPAVAEKIGRTYQAVKDKASDLGLNFPNRIRKDGGFTTYFATPMDGANLAARFAERDERLARTLVDPIRDFLGDPPCGRDAVGMESEPQRLMSSRSRATAACAIAAMDDCRTADDVRARAARSSAFRRAAFAVKRDPVITAPAHPVQPSYLTRIPLSDIVKITAAYFKFSPRDFSESARMRKIAYARQIGMFIAHMVTAASYTHIALVFGWASHGSAAQSVAAITELMLSLDAETVKAVTSITVELQDMFPMAVELPKRPPQGRPRKHEQTKDAA